MVERDDRQAIAGFYWDGAVDAGPEARLAGDVARHASVRRLRPGERVRLTDGKGALAFGAIVSVNAKELVVAVDRRRTVPPPIPLIVLAPVADRDRMMVAAEKCAELQVTAWQPVWFARSRSVSPRGEGEKFRDKVRARMISALEQSGAAWLPELRPELELDAAFQAVDAPLRILMDASGSPMADLDLRGPLAIAVGPEGGLESSEIDAARARGWSIASLAGVTLRFETAILAAVAVVRAQQLSTRSD